LEYEDSVIGEMNDCIVCRQWGGGCSGNILTKYYIHGTVWIWNKFWDWNFAILHMCCC